jgi:hypothetical protein
LLQAIEPFHPVWGVSANRPSGPRRFSTQISKIAV